MPEYVPPSFLLIPFGVASFKMRCLTCISYRQVDGDYQALRAKFYSLKVLDLCYAQKLCRERCGLSIVHQSAGTDISTNLSALIRGPVYGWCCCTLSIHASLVHYILKPAFRLLAKSI